MKATLLKVLVATALFLLSPANVWAEGDGIASSAAKVKPPKAPEIDAASGTVAIALLSGAVLLLREKRRSRPTD